MEKELGAIVGKLSDYKICDKCGVINFYENESCHNCSHDKFNESENCVLKYVSDEYEEYKQYDFSEYDIDTLEIQV